MAALCEGGRRIAFRPLNGLNRAAQDISTWHESHLKQKNFPERLPVMALQHASHRINMPKKKWGKRGGGRPGLKNMPEKKRGGEGRRGFGRCKALGPNIHKTEPWKHARILYSFIRKMTGNQRVSSN